MHLQDHHSLGVIELEIYCRAYFDPLEQCGEVGFRERQFSLKHLKKGRKVNGKANGTRQMCHI